VPDLSLCNDNRRCTTDTCTPRDSLNYDCLSEFSVSNCLPAPGNFPTDCGIFTCDNNSDCGVLLNSSLCIPRTFLVCETYVCQSLTGVSDTEGCDRVNTCQQDCECLATPSFPNGNCVCGGPRKRSLKIEDLSSAIFPIEWNLFLVFVVEILFLMI
jgi:hypothetical protein